MNLPYSFFLEIRELVYIVLILDFDAIFSTQRQEAVNNALRGIGLRKYAFFGFFLERNSVIGEPSDGILVGEAIENSKEFTVPSWVIFHKLS